MIGANLLAVHSRSWGLVLSLLLGIRLLRTNYRKLQITCLIFYFCMLGIFLVKMNQVQKEQELVYPANGSEELLLLIDTIKIDGKQLQAKCISPSKKKLLFYYQFSSETEKRSWEKITTDQLLKVAGSFVQPSGQRNKHGFDYQKYLKQQEIYAIFQATEIVTRRTKTWSFKNPAQFLRVLRKKVAKKLDQNLPHYLKIYTKSLTLGIKDQEFTEVQQIWNEVGIVYLLNISGMQLTFFVTIFCLFLLRIGIMESYVFWMGNLFLVFLLPFMGFSISIWRGIFQLLLTRCNKRYRWYLSPLDCWSLVLMLVLWLQPYLLFQVAGQLSFGLTFFSLYVTSIKQVPKQRFKRLLCLSLLLSLCSFPILCFHFNEYHLLSFLFSCLFVYMAKQFLLPIVVFSLVCGLFFSNWQLNVGLLICEKILQYLELLLSFLGKLSFLRIQTGQIATWQLLLALFLVFCWLALLTERRDSLKYCLLLLIFYSSFFWGKYINPVGTFAFVDVGQGDALFIQLPFHRGNYLIDTGGRLQFTTEKWQTQTATVSNAARTLLPYLKSKAVTKLDCVFITHADADHMGDLAELSEKVKIKKLVFPEGTDKKKSFSKVRAKLAAKGTLTSAIIAVQTVLAKEVQLTAIAPSVAGTGSNNDSLVLYGSIKKTTFLLTGDLEEAGEKALISSFPDLTADVLKVGHHGSRTSSSAPFIQQFQPAISVISCGENNRFGHPHEEVIKTLQNNQTKILRTDQLGMIYYEWYVWDQKLPAIKTIR